MNSLSEMKKRLKEEISTPIPQEMPQSLPDYINTKLTQFKESLSPNEKVGLKIGSHVLMLPVSLEYNNDILCFSGDDVNTGKRVDVIIHNTQLNITLIPLT